MRFAAHQALRDTRFPHDEGLGGLCHAATRVQPRRLTKDTLKVWLRELQDERDPWALRFLKDAQDAAELKRLRAIGIFGHRLKGVDRQKASSQREASSGRLTPSQ